MGVEGLEAEALPLPPTLAFLASLSFPFEVSLKERFLEGEGLLVEALPFNASATFKRATLLSERGRIEGERRALDPRRPAQSKGRARRLSFSEAVTLDLALARRASLLASMVFRYVRAHKVMFALTHLDAATMRAEATSSER